MTLYHVTAEVSGTVHAADPDDAGLVFTMRLRAAGFNVHGTDTVPALSHENTERK